MNKIVFAVLALAFATPILAAEVTYTSPTNGTIVKAAVVRPVGATDSGALRTAVVGKVIYDSGDVAAGAVINSPVLDLSACSSLRVRVKNLDAAAARSLNFNEYLSDLTTSISGLTTVVSVIANSIPSFGFAAVSSVTASAVAGVPVAASFQLAAGGTAVGRIVIICR